MMDSFAALKVITRYRGEALIITTMTAQAELPQVSTRPELDLPLGGAMGKASSLGLGLALALPKRKVIVLDGDGSLLMNLGTLITIAHLAPPNLVHFVLENRVYRTTGGQPIPESGRFSFTALAKAAGYAGVCEFADLTGFENDIQKILGQNGPTFVCLKLKPMSERPPFPFPRTAEALPRFKAAIAGSAI